MKIKGVDAKVPVYGSDLEKGTSFSYLGSTITAGGQLDGEIDQRIGKAGRALWALKSIWISLHSKMIFYTTCVLSLMMYGAETGCMKVVNGDIMDVFNSQCLRRIRGVRWVEGISIKDIQSRTKQHNTTCLLRKKRLLWFGNLSRMTSDRITR